VGINVWIDDIKEWRKKDLYSLTKEEEE